MINVHEIATMLQLEENVIDLIYVYWKLKRKVGTRLLLRQSESLTRDSHHVTIRGECYRSYLCLLETQEKGWY